MAEKNPDSGVTLIRNKVKTLPGAPGVYRMLDAKGAALYVGKAKHLRNRVTSYTRLGGQSNRIARMIQLTHDMEFIRTETEADALLLEANLIKKLKPRFNVLLRDDKSFPYILLARDHAIPILLKHRGAKKRPGAYFGPFASAGAVKRTLDALQRAFLLRSCSDSVYQNRTRPCLLYQIKRCSAPCTGEISASDYAALVGEAEQFLQGDSRAVQEGLVKQMQAASERLDFEAAARARDRIRALTFIQSDSDINASAVGEADIIAIAQSGGQSCVQVFFFRAGQNLGNRAYFPRHERGMSEADVLESFIGQFYEKRPPPKQIMVNQKLAGRAVLAEALSLTATHRVAISQPQRGKKRAMVTLATQNAREAMARRITESATQRRLLAELARQFSLDAPPRRIDVFDNSHLQGSNQLGGMIVTGREGFIKKQYRRFNIRNADTAPGDDIAMMREVITRRYGRMQREAAETRPDLILVDGGQAQFNAAHAALADLGLADIPLVAIAKGKERNAGRERFFTAEKQGFSLPPTAPILYYLQRLRDEAHRFAIGGQRARRARDMRQNPLDAIGGIGARRKKALLHHFGSARAVTRAALADLEKVDGINAKLAQKIYAHFNES